MQLINSEHIFSHYNNLLLAKKLDNEFDVNQPIEVIKYVYIKREIELLRSVNLHVLVISMVIKGEF
jgi:hypothetical protein